MLMIVLYRRKYFQYICQKYNQAYKIQIPKVTHYVCVGIATAQTWLKAQ